jgi:four helix bundle protein
LPLLTCRFRLPASGFRFHWRLSIPIARELPDSTRSRAMQDYRKLRVWQKAHQLAVNAYALPAYLQEPKGWALRDQILKAAISIPSNIAEGAGRGSDPDFARFLWYSMGSCNEFESDLLLGGDVKLIPSGVLAQLGNEVSEVRQVLSRLVQTVEGARPNR